MLSIRRTVDATVTSELALIDGFPDGAARLRERLEAAEAFVIASPQYHFSVPAGLKNVIDWVSRYRPQPFHGKHGMLLSGSPSMAGGNRGLWALRVPLEHPGARLDPDMFSLAQCRAFTDAGGIAAAGPVGVGTCA